MREQENLSLESSPPSIDDPKYLEYLKTLSPNAFLEAVNEDLKVRGLLKEKLFSVGKKECASLAAEASQSHDSDFQLPPISEMIGAAPEKEAGLLYRLALDEEFRSNIFNVRAPGASSSLGDWLAPRPADLREATLRRLFKAGHFGLRREDLRIGRKPTKPKAREYNSKLEAVAYFMMRSLGRPDLVETYLPGLSYEEFHRLRSVVNRAIDQNLSKKALKFNAFLSDSRLKKAQKEAVIAAYLENGDDLNQKQIAKRLKIPLGTLQARLKSAKQILKKHFPEWKPKEKSGFWERVLKPRTDLRDSGLLRLSSCKVPKDVYRIDPKTKEQVDRLRPRMIHYWELRQTLQKDYVKNARFHERTSYEPRFDDFVAPRRGRRQLEYPRPFRFPKSASGASYVMERFLKSQGAKI